MLEKILSYLRSAWPTIRVVAVFIGLIVVFFGTLTYTPIVERVDIAWLLAKGAAVASWVLLEGLGRLAGFPVLLEGTNLRSNTFVVDVSPACSGAVPSMIYLAAIFAYPASWKAKLIGAGLGMAIIHGANLIRVVGLFLIGLFATQFFHETHVYIAQALVVAIAVATWLFWAGRYVDASGR
jgi:exosortase/archaeosortase family protein